MKVLTCWVLLAGLAHAEPSLEAARAAVAAAPDRPGLRLALAEHLLAAGDLAGAEAEARAVVARWPTAGRARLLLARVARARGEPAEAARWLAEVEALGSPLLSAAARRLQPEAPGPWSGWARLAGQYDTHAASAGTVRVVPAQAADTPAFRTAAAAGLGYRGARLVGWAGVERSLHLPAGGRTGGDDVATLDRTSAWAEARHRTAVGPHRLELGLAAQGVLAGRPGAPSYAGGGPTLGWRHTGGPLEPYAALRGLALATAEAGPLAWGSAEVGVAGHLGRLAGSLEVEGAWLGPGISGGREVGAGLRLGRSAGRVRPFAAAGGVLRDDARGVRPYGLGGLGLVLTRHLTLAAEVGWQHTSAAHRLLGGLALEITP